MIDYARKLTAHVFLAALLLAAAAPAAYSTDYHWIGAGTGGNIATDPADPTTQWNNPANWLENKVPTATEGAYVSLTGGGYANLQSGSVGGIFMSGSSLDGAMHIGAGVDFTAAAPAGGVVPGYSGQGRIVQTGGSFTLNGILTVGWTGTGSYLLQDGTLSVAKDEAIGHNGTGTFTQTGGTHTVVGKLSVADYGTGALNVGGGGLQVAELRVNGGGTLNVTSSQAVVKAVQVYLYQDSIVTAVPGSAIHISNDGFYNYSTNESALSGLANLTLVFDAADKPRSVKVEVGGRDMGAVPGGFTDNFALGALDVGGTQPIRAVLFDLVDNGNRASAECLYVHNVSIAIGSELDLNGLNVYYDGTLVNNGSIIGGTPAYIPEPASIILLGAGLAAIASFRRRRLRRRP